MVIKDKKAIRLIHKLEIAFHCRRPSDALIKAFEEINRFTLPDALVHTDSIPDAYVDEIYSK